MKRILAYLAAVIAVISLLAGGTLSYRTIEIRTTNLVTTGSVALTIHEKTDTGAEFSGGGITVMPGQVISRITTVENSGTVPVYLRVKLTKQVNDSTLSAENCLDMDINTADWTYQDGYYYYNTALPAGVFTAPLFTTITVDGFAVDNRYLGKVLSLDISADSVQSRHNGATVWDAIGWPNS